MKGPDMAVSLVPKMVLGTQSLPVKPVPAFRCLTGSRTHYRQGT